MSRRGPFWRPGMGLTEPWVALAETNTGRLMVPCSRDHARAAEVVHHWRLLVEQLDGMIDLVHHCVGAAVIDPAGNIVDGWGVRPDPFAAPHWAPISRVRESYVCGGCGLHRWAGCWAATDGDGCSACMPARELATPRRWPAESPEPPPPPAKGKRGARNS